MGILFKLSFGFERKVAIPFKKHISDPLIKTLKDKGGLRAIKDVFESMGGISPFKMPLETFKDLGKTVSQSLEGALMTALEPILQPILDGLNWLSGRIAEGLGWLVNQISGWFAGLFSPGRVATQEEAEIVRERRETIVEAGAKEALIGGTDLYDKILAAFEESKKAMDEMVEEQKETNRKLG